MLHKYIHRHTRMNAKVMIVIKTKKTVRFHLFTTLLYMLLHFWRSVTSIDHKGFHLLTSNSDGLDIHQKQRVHPLHSYYLHAKHDNYHCFQQLTSDKLWPPQKAMWFICSTWTTYMLSMSIISVTLLEVHNIHWSLGFQHFPLKLWWSQPQPVTIGFICSTRPTMLSMLLLL